MDGDGGNQAHAPRQDSFNFVRPGFGLITSVRFCFKFVATLKVLRFDRSGCSLSVSSNQRSESVHLTPFLAFTLEAVPDTFPDTFPVHAREA